MEREIIFNERVDESISARIDEEVERDVAVIADEDPETAEFLKELQRDYRSSEYLFLRWIKERYAPKSVIYPGSGSDIMPTLAFGEGKVLHTSLDAYIPGDSVYLPHLGSEPKLIADNARLPFENESFEVIYLSAYPIKLIEQQLGEFMRIIKPGGLFIITNSILIDERIDPGSLLAVAEPMQAPEHFQKRGDAEVEFEMYRKI